MQAASALSGTGKTIGSICRPQDLLERHALLRRAVDDRTELPWR